MGDLQLVSGDYSLGTIHELEESYSLQGLNPQVSQALRIQPQSTCLSSPSAAPPLLALFRFLLFDSKCMEILIISLNIE